MPRLPPELIPFIAIHVAQQDLSSFALTCRDFNEVARRRRTWRIKNVGKAVEFLDMLKSDATSPSSLRPSSIRCVALGTGPGFKEEDKPYQPQEALCLLVGIITIVTKCVNLVQVGIPDLGDEPRDPRAEKELFDSLAKLDNLKILVLGISQSDIKAFAGFTRQFRGHLDLLFGVLGGDYEDITVHPCSVQDVHLALQRLNDHVFTKFARALLPYCRNFDIMVIGNVTLAVLADSFSLPTATPFTNRTVSFNSTASPELFKIALPLRNDGMSVFYSMSSKHTSNGTAGTIRKGYWSQPFIKRSLRLFEKAVGPVWVRKGDDMGDEGKKLVLDEAQKWGKEVVWF